MEASEALEALVGAVVLVAVEAAAALRPSNEDGQIFHYSTSSYWYQPPLCTCHPSYCPLYYSAWFSYQDDSSISKVSTSPIIILTSNLSIVWRLVTGPFAHTSFINLLFSVISYVPSAVMEENEMGTVPFAIRFFKLTMFIDVLFSIIAIGVGMTFWPRMINTPCMGLWPILMCDIVIQCYQDPEMPRGLCCLPIQIKSKWYPLILIAIFMIFFGIQFDLMTGMGVGYLYVFGYLNCLVSSPDSLRAWEKRWPFSSF